MRLHVIIPMAGRGSRFSDFGFKTPKFLLPINTKGETMIHAAVDTLNTKDSSANTMYTFITLRTIISDELKQSMSEYNPQWVVLDEVTDGPATTVLKGISTVEDDVPLLVSNSDQILVNWDCDRFIQMCSEHDGGVLTYTPPYEVKMGDIDKHSFVQMKDGKCTAFAEKIVLSNQALIGVHYFRNKRVFVNAYNDMVSKNERAPNGEFYLSLMYNSLVRRGRSVVHVPLQENEQFFPTGEPKDYFRYLNNISRYGPRPYLSKNISGIFSSPQLTVVIDVPTGKKDNTVYVDLERNSVSTTPPETKCVCITSECLFDKEFEMKLSELTRGWLIGDFTPSLVRTKEFEIGILSHKSGEKWPYHIHDFQDEYNYLINGHMTVNDLEYLSGDNFALLKGHLAVPHFMSDCRLVCIKFPSIPSDKRIM